MVKKTVSITRKQQLKKRAMSGRRKTTYLARTYISRQRQKVNAMIYKGLKKFSETHIIPTQDYDGSLPAAIQPTNNTYWWGGCLGADDPTLTMPWSGGFNFLSGIGTAQGDLSTQRTGNYIYLNKTHMTLQINMNARAVESTTVHEFRVIVFKTRRATNPVARYPEPVRELFLDSIGNPFGHETVTKDGTDIMLQPLNKRQFVIFMDKRFLMTPQMSQNNQVEGINQRYGSFKRIPINFNHKIKCRIPLPPEPGSIGFPSNYDYFYGVVVYARPVDAFSPANEWTVNARGSTTFMDN